MAVSQQERTLFKDSLKRCVSDSKFLDRFYVHFLSSSDEVKEKFKNTNMANQKIILKASLYIMETAAGGTIAQGLKNLADSHDRNNLDIKPEFYEFWLNSMVSAVKDIDPQFSPDIEQAWRATMRPGMDYMQSKY